MIKSVVQVLTMEVTKQEAKEAFVLLYGDKIFNPEFETFESAFDAAWESFDYISDAESIEDFCSGMTECWQLTEG